MQWGVFTLAGQTGAISFPLTFPNACDTVFCSATVAGYIVAPQANISTTGFIALANTSMSAPMYWVAFGH